jgi:Met-zincin
MKTTSFHKAAIAATAAALLASCAQETPAINRVQPNYYEKEFFIGKDFNSVADDPEFYSQGTLIDVGYGAAQDGLFTSTYAQPLTRVKWTAQEDLLIARLAYERVEGSDGRGTGKATNDGIVVAAFRIQHFDIKRNYNPATGELGNVIYEDVQDRPWNERKYMRVDWSRNLSTDNFDYDTLSQIGVYGGVSYEPLAYDITDPKHPDAPHFDAANGYLDVTNKAFARPLMVDLSIWGAGMMPACWFDADFAGGSYPAAGCSPVELTIRHSFKKVTDQDYEPADWDGVRFQAYGAFTTDRLGYARNYGMTDTQWHRFINRYNLWDRSHFYSDPAAMTGAVACFTPETTPAGLDPHRDLNKDGTEDECASVGVGSRCDTFKQKCTLPFKDRVVRPVVWYFSSGSHQEAFEPTRDAANEWDVALRSAVMTARYTECVKTGGSDCATLFPVFSGQMDDNQDAVELTREVDDCRAGLVYQGMDCNALADRLGTDRGYSPAVIALAKLSEALVLCHSPVEANDPTACGTPRLPVGLTAEACGLAEKNDETATITKCRAALSVRNGDLRYHRVNVIPTPQTPSPWGIMVDSNDPLTGEVVSASINVWSHVTDLWSQGVVDMARYAKGELETSEITEGTYIKDWASAAEAANENGSLPKITEDQRLSLLANGAGVSDSAQLRLQKQNLKNSPVWKELKAIAKEGHSFKADALAPVSTRLTYEARRKHALNTATEAALTTKMMQSYSGGNGRFDSNTVASIASPLRGANPTVQREIRNRKELALADRGACIMHEAPAPLALPDLAEILQAKFGKFDKSSSKADQLARASKMQKWLAYRAQYAVVTHEMGHSIGLRHNFVSSSDAYNYRPQYWQLRTDNGTNAKSCPTLDPTGSCVGPRYFDPITQNEKKNLIGMWMQSSTMDYAGEATQDLLGLGAYDFAAARMFYGESAAVFKDPSFKAGTPRGVGALDKLDNFGGILGFGYVLGAGNDTQDIHYSQLQKEVGMIQGCRAVDANMYKPARWNEALLGAYHPVVDGMTVEVGGAYSRCKQQPVDYVTWNELRDPTAQDVANARGGHAIDKAGRVRVPYGFATDRWADLGNLSVYRHDNGADPYELFDFLITSQEVNHIFDNYRRNRMGFSVRSASNRALSRYNEKLRDAAKGLGLMANVYRDFGAAMGYDFDSLWASISGEFFGPNMLASGMGFDHFAKQLARPEPGPHQLGTQNGNRILYSSTDASGNAGATVLNMHNGATGYFGNVAFGGRPIENALANGFGEYDSDFTINAGSYYEKAWTAMLMTESVDNFISDSRRDFTDARYRAVSMADLFPDGYRRWLSTYLTGDESLKGARVAATAQGAPLVDTAKFPTQGIGFTSWWKPSPESCFAQEKNLLCTSAPAASMPIESQVGWEQQKFLIAWTLLYLPENQQQTWLNQMNIWERGADSDPGFGNRIELQLPSGKNYVAKTFGKETIFGKSVQKGIAARMLEWGNDLLNRAYVTTGAPDNDGDGQPDWYIPTLVNGQPVVKYDPSVSTIDANGLIQTGRPGCNASENTSCTCSSNKACLELQKFEEMPFFMRQAMRDYGLADPSMKGIY